MIHRLQAAKKESKCVEIWEPASDIDEVLGFEVGYAEPQHLKRLC